MDDLKAAAIKVTHPDSDFPHLKLDNDSLNSHNTAERNHKWTDNTALTEFRRIAYG